MGEQMSGKKFGLDYDYEVDYRSLQKKFQREELDDWVIMPICTLRPL
jgi:microcin C transport system permease protein